MQRIDMLFVAADVLIIVVIYKLDTLKRQFTQLLVEFEKLNDSTRKIEAKLSGMELRFNAELERSRKMWTSK